MTSSEKLYLYNATPGVFYTEDRMSNPYPELLRGYDPEQLVGNLTQQSGKDVRVTNAPFMLGTWNATGSDLDSNDKTWHMYYGAKEQHDLKAPNKKWNNWYGWGNIYSAVTHSLYRGTGDNYGNFPNLELYTQRQMTESQGILIGSRYIEEAYESTARWMSPVGIQFKWHNYFTKGSATGLKMYNLFLMYHDLWAPTRPLYAPIVKNGVFTNGASYTKGSDLMSDSAKENGGNKGGRSGGEFVGFVDPNSMDVIKDKYTRSACIGFYIDMRVTAYDGAIYDKVFDFWDFKNLFDVSQNESMVVVPQPHNLKERMEGGKVKLL